MRIVAAGVGLVLILAGCGHRAESAPITTSHTAAEVADHDVAGAVRPDPRVGALFLSDTDLHACTGSVLHSATGNLVLTAAHCLSVGGPAKFVPGLAGTAVPGDVWTVDAMYFDPRWLTGKDPLADFAIARVGRASGGSIEAAVGSALVLGSTPAAGTEVSVIGYPAGVGGRPVACRATTRLNAGGFPELPCAGLADGTSGAPWITGSTVRALIGGPHGGGCAEDLSFSPPFDANITHLLARAEAAGPGDAPPGSFDDRC